MGDKNLFEFREQFRERKGCGAGIRRALIHLLKKM